MSGARVLLITGASGLVGREVLRRALTAGCYDRIVAMSRRPPAVRAEAVEGVAGDVTLPRFGLPAPAYERLTSEVSDVLHAAADTRFDRPLEEARRANVEGTWNAMCFARRCPRLFRVLHVSTAHVAGLSPGRVPEAPLSGLRTYANTYQRSKFEAEDLVASCMDDVPVSIARISTLMGDSRDGHVERLNYLHGLVRLLPLGLSPIVAVDPDARVDLVASDWAMDALFAVLARAFEPGRVYHLCAGPEGSLPVAVLMEETRQGFARWAATSGGKEVRLPRIVPREEYAAFLDGLRRSGPKGAARILGALELFLPHLRIRQSFETRATRAALDGTCPAQRPSVDTFRRVLDWCLRTQYGARSAEEGLEEARPNRRLFPNS